jgi:hypothetical protein
VVLIFAIAPAHELLAGPMIGPDVITYQIGPSLVRYSNVGSTAAYSMDTISCNLGDADAIWITDGPQPNRHPLISQNMYRLKTVAGATRFEQIGMSWLKHGFCAADEQFPSCGNCVPDESCDWLTPGCSDTYTASLNGTQFVLGPRSDVNAATGAYPYPFTPYTLPPHVGRRLQIDNSDLDPAQNAGAQYFAEAHYLSTDEPSWNTQFNNASWRPASVTTFTAGGWNMSFSDTTHQQESAIQAWSQLDQGVTLVDVYIDGRLILGYKVTPLGGGMWHYEYSLYNMNSDRSVQKVIVPLYSGTTIANEGFHDVNYHSNEIYSSADWVIDPISTEISWYTDTYANNVNANALRWGTTYSYRFDADRPPEPGIVTLDLFKPGSPTSIQVAAAVPSVPCACPGDLNASGAINGDDVQTFVSAYLGGPFTPCADLASPFGVALDNSDLDSFVAAVLASAACP